jgi:Zn-dependent oligopeptidase
MFDFTTVTAASIAASTEQALADADAAIDAIVAVEGPRTHENTIRALDLVILSINDAYGRGPFMARVHPDEEVRRVAVELEERVAKWASDLVFRRDLYEAVSEFAATDAAASLPEDQRRLVDHWIRDFARAGHLLEPADRAELQRLQDRLIELEVAYASNLDEWEDHLEVPLSALATMPPEYIDGLSTGSREDTRLVSMAYPDVMPFMQQVPDRELRRQLQHKFWNRATVANTPLLQEAVGIRAEIAELLGHRTWAHHAMEVKMASGPEAIAEFYASLIDGLDPLADTEITGIADLLDEEHPGAAVAAWDTAYYTNEIRKAEYGVDPNDVAAYFPLERVVEGMFEVTGEVFGLEYREIADTRAWHPDVKLYSIHDSGTDDPIAYFYADLFPRPGKYGHAAAFSIEYGYRRDDGSYRPPIAAIVANFTKPTATAPSLLKHNEALTLWHEFGHILHFCLTKVDIARFSGFDTEWDFVEAPSQIMENWMWEPEVLQRFAQHHETGEPIPADLVERLVAARDLHQGLATLRQIYLGTLDMGLHAEAGYPDVDKVTREAYRVTKLPFHEGTAFAASFGHLMGGYDAGYYGYLWARVYGDDMFSEFARHGVLDPGVGRRYRREVLERGGERDAIDHLRAFLGREPSSEAFLTKLGIG